MNEFLDSIRDMSIEELASAQIIISERLCSMHGENAHFDKLQSDILLLINIYLSA